MTNQHAFHALRYKHNCICGCKVRSNNNEYLQSTLTLSILS